MIDRREIIMNGSGTLSRHRVLVVDDDQAVLSLLRRALVVAGYDVLVAEDGETALTLAGTQEPALVVLDVMLPGIDGFTVAHRLRATSATPILMLTAKDTVPDRVTGLDSGADDYLVKPFSVEEFLARVRALLRRVQAPAPDVLTYRDLTVDIPARQAFRSWRGATPLTASRTLSTSRSRPCATRWRKRASHV
jgi:two-component system, OmpR family, response regulator MprA